MPVALQVKNPPISAGDATDMGSIPGLGRSPEKGMATHSSILAWRIPWQSSLVMFTDIHLFNPYLAKLKLLPETFWQNPSGS